MRYDRLFAEFLAASMALAFWTAPALAKPAAKEKKDGATAGQVESKPGAATSSQCCPRCCGYCPLQSTSATAPTRAPTGVAGVTNANGEKGKVVKSADVAPAGSGGGAGPCWQGGPGRRGGGGPAWMRVGAIAGNDQPGAQARVDDRSPMAVFHALLDQHTKIRRTVAEIPGGVFTVTSSEDPIVARDIQIHVRQMKERLENGQPLRRWDPLFEELFSHASKITMKIEQTKDGAKVTETSEDPQVVKLIRQHATKGVSEFVKDGFDRAHKSSPLPEGYQTEPSPAPAGAKDAKPADGRPRWGQQGR